MQENKVSNLGVFVWPKFIIGVCRGYTLTHYSNPIISLDHKIVMAEIAIFGQDLASKSLERPGILVVIYLTQQTNHLKARINMIKKST